MTGWGRHNYGLNDRREYRREWSPPKEEPLDASFTDELYYDYYLIRRDGEVAIQWLGRDGQKTRQSPSTWKHKAPAKLAAEDHIGKMKRARTHTGRNFSTFAFRLIDCPENNDPMRIRDNWDQDWTAAVKHFSEVSREG